jgi:hypothetical protein
LHLGSIHGVHLMDANSWVETTIIHIPAYPYDLASLPTGELVIAANTTSSLTRPGGAHLLDTATGLLKSLVNTGCSAIAASGDVIVASTDKEVFVWRLLSDQGSSEWVTINRLQSPDCVHAHVSIDGRGQTFAVYDSKRIRVYRLGTTANDSLDVLLDVAAHRDHSLAEDAIALSGDGHLCAAVTAQGVVVYDTIRGHVLTEIPGKCSAVAITPQNQVIVGCMESLTAYDIDVR